MESEQALHLASDGPISLLSTPLPTPTTDHSVTINQGDVSLAGRDGHVHRHYHSYSDRVDITAVLRIIRNHRMIHSDVLSKATPGTGVWLLKSDKFLIWLDLNSDLKIMWGVGILGAGKTVLMSIVIDEVEARAAAVGGSICVCYVYFRYSDSADLTVRNVLEILMKQTVERHPEYTVMAEKAYAFHLREGTQPTEADLLQLLHQFTETFAATFYFLDALDEAPDWIQVDLVRKLASLNIRLFITSRWLLTAVEAQLPDTHRFHIVAQEDDLDLHIAQQIARSRELSDLLERDGLSLREEIVSSVKSKCDGMFLHASLHLDALCECMIRQEVRQTLLAFPPSIEDAYLQAWNRLLNQKTRHVLLAKAVLVWVMNALRPMTTGELERAVATSPSTLKFKPDEVVPGRSLVALCCGLVVFEEESRLVRLVHYTAKDTVQHLLQDSFPHPHSHLARVCMTHLAECGFQDTTISSEEEFRTVLEMDPLLAYASEAWVFHAQEGLALEETKRRIAQFVSETHAFPFITGTYASARFDILAPLHILALYNLPLGLVEDSAAGDPNVTTKILQQTPLMLASGLGHEDFVAQFAALPGTQVNFVDADGWSALMRAAHAGHEGIVKLLLAHPEIQVNLVDRHGWSALMRAARAGHEGAVTLLLARPEIQVNVEDADGWSALMWAAHAGHEGVATLLLARPDVRVNLVDRHGWSALMRAAHAGHEGVVTLLLAWPDIQVNLVDSEGSSALMLAAHAGHEGIIKLLLVHPRIQANLVDIKGSSALMRAAGADQERIAEVFLSRPEIDVNLVDKEGWSALMRAAHEGYEEIVELFLARSDIQVNLVDKEGCSALKLAGQGGREGTVKLLLAHPGIRATTMAMIHYEGGKQSKKVPLSFVYWAQKLQKHRSYMTFPGLLPSDILRHWRA